jgi:hypothetical protein
LISGAYSLIIALDAQPISNRCLRDSYTHKKIEQATFPVYWLDEKVDVVLLKKRLSNGSDCVIF